MSQQAKPRVLLVYLSEVMNALIDSSLRVVPIGLSFINGYLKKQDYQTKLINLVTANLNEADFDQIILSYDFATNQKLNYFFPHITVDRQIFLTRVYRKLRKHKRIVFGQDMIVDKKTGILTHHPDLGVVENPRPWHIGMRGRVDI